MNMFFKRFSDFFKVYHTTKLFILLLFLSIIILFIVDYKWINSGEDFNDFIGNVLVEAHGVLGDLVIFGVILTIYDTYRSNKEKKLRKELELENKIERLKEEIDDYRGWEADEAKFRIIGNIRRLQKLGCYEIDLSNCYLENSKIENMKFHNSNFEATKFQNCKFINCEFFNCKYNYSDFSKVIFYEVDIENLDLSKAKLEGTSFYINNFSLNKRDGKTKIIVDEKYVVLRTNSYDNTIVKPSPQSILSTIRSNKNENIFFLVSAEDAEEYKKNNKRVK